MFWKTRTVCVPPGRGVTGHVGKLGDTDVAIIPINGIGTIVEVTERDLHLRQVRIIGGLDDAQEVDLALDGKCQYEGLTLALEGA